MKKLPPDKLLQSPEEGARLLVSSFTRDARDALQRLGDASDEEALHAFRVSLRRLRSVGRAWLPWLQRSRAEHGLAIARRLASKTNSARDLEVQIEWLERLRSELTATRRRALDHLLAELRERATLARRGSTDGLGRAFARLDKAMRGQGQKRGTLARLGGAVSGPSFAEVAADLLKTHASRLHRELDDVAGPWDEANAHRARVQVKRLRYLLKPFARSVPGGKRLVRDLKSLQAVLGDFNDQRLLIQSVTASLERHSAVRVRSRLDAVLGGDPESARALGRRTIEDGLLELAERANQKRLALYQTFEETWKGESGETFFSELDAFVVALATLGGPAQPSASRHLSVVR